MWDQAAIKNHRKAAQHILAIKNQIPQWINQSDQESTEHTLTQRILNEFKSRNLRTDEPPMVAFRENTNNIHYIAQEKTTKTLQKESLIMADLWAGLKKDNAPFADVTWMFYFGKTPSPEIMSTFKNVKAMQTHCLRYIKRKLNQKKLPVGKNIHQTIKRFFEKESFPGKRNNYTGHCIGFTSPHGRYGNLNKGSRKKLQQNLGYTLEPEIDHKNFGIRLELNFYISPDFELILTTPQQKELTIIST